MDTPPCDGMMLSADQDGPADAAKTRSRREPRQGVAAECLLARTASLTLDNRQPNWP